MSLTNGHIISSNGHHTNGISNGHHTNGVTNGISNGHQHTNGVTNGISNGHHTNGVTNGISKKKKIITFSPGPAKLPNEVLHQAQEELVDFEGLGHSIMEMSHRSPDFEKVLNKAKTSIRELMNVPSNYRIIFLQGGGCGQFACVPMNLINLKSSRKADYLVTGSWSDKAAQEAEKYGEVRRVFSKRTHYTEIPHLSSEQIDPEASYLFYCDNETVHGVEFATVPECPPGVELVCDMSSNFMSRPVDVSKFGVIFAGAQKNVGCAGVTVVIIREDLMGHALPITPAIFDYKIQEKNNSLYNTPPTFGIYILGLVLEWIERSGGLNAMSDRSIQKSDLLYNYIDKSDGFYSCDVKPACRSKMNVVFRIKDGDEDLEKKFVDEAKKSGLLQLKGHRIVGGLRASIYNAISPEDVECLVQFLKHFKSVTLYAN